MANKFLTDRHQEAEPEQGIKAEYPRWVFKAGEEMRLVLTPEEHKPLEKDGWTGTPQPGKPEATKGKK